jgi:hypothetical protein
MTGFLEIARRAKREHDKRLEQARIQADHAARLQRKAFLQAVDALKITVLPTLRAAKAELACEGIPLVIEDNFNSADEGAIAEISFKLMGPDIPSKHAGRVTPESVPAFFSHDGSLLSFGMGRRGALMASNLREVIGDPGIMIEHAIAEAAASYYADIQAASPAHPAPVPGVPEIPEISVVARFR